MGVKLSFGETLQELDALLGEHVAVMVRDQQHLSRPYAFFRGTLTSRDGLIEGASAALYGFSEADPETGFFFAPEMFDSGSWDDGQRRLTIILRDITIMIYRDGGGVNASKFD